MLAVMMNSLLLSYPLYYINQSTHFYVTYYKLQETTIDYSTTLLGRKVIQLLPVRAPESLSTTTISDPQQSLGKEISMAFC